MRKETKQIFMQLLLSYNYSEKVAEELWKWYGHSEKKDVAGY